MLTTIRVLVNAYRAFVDTGILTKVLSIILALTVIWFTPDVLEFIWHTTINAMSALFNAVFKYIVLAIVALIIINHLSND